MKPETYTQLLNATLKLYAEQGSLAAYNFITAHQQDVEGNDAQILNFRYCLASAAGLPTQALEIMSEAIDSRGYWYRSEYLMEDDDLRALHGRDEFERMIRICVEREQAAVQSTRPRLMVAYGTIDNTRFVDTVTSRGTLASPLEHIQTNNLWLVLHGNQENATMTAPYWRSCAAHQDVLALPQSSQIEFSNAYSWDDVHLGTQELGQQYVFLQTTAVPRGATILGGFSAGAGIALYSLLTGTVEADGFVLVAPWLPDLDSWTKSLDSLVKKSVKGYLICGDADEDCLAGTLQLAELFRQKHVPYVLKIVNGLAHDYPVDFESMLADARVFFDAE